MVKRKELYKKYRPKEWDDVCGQDSIVINIGKMISNRTVPHAMLFAGPTGTGKTTVARILARELNCGDMDLVEQNAASFRGIDEARRIEQIMNLAPISGDCRVWIIDEAHKLTNDAQNCFLKPLEDTPDHVYFILCTSEPNKLIKAVRGRCTLFTFDMISRDDLDSLVEKVIKKEDMDVADKVKDKIVEMAGGSARNALVMLDQVMECPPNTEKQLKAISGIASEKDAIEICRLMFNQKADWEQMAKLLDSMGRKDDEAEKIRRLVLSYATTMLLTNNKKCHGRAFLAIQEFRDNYFDCGFAGLVGSLFAVFNTD